MECFLNKSIVDTKQLYKDYTTVRKFTKQRAVYEIDMFFMKVFKMIGDMKKHEKHHGCRMMIALIPRNRYLRVRMQRRLSKVS